MKWIKIGNLFCPHSEFEWMNSHAANPFAVHLRMGIYRVFFTSRNKFNQSHIAYVDIDFDDNFKIVGLASNPVLSPGSPGLFDDSGVAMGCLLKVSNQYHLYYLGWNLKVTVPWMNTIGLAVSDSLGGPFKKHSMAPLMDRSHEDPYSISYPFILKDQNLYRMWYGSNLSWGKDEASMQHIIKYAESTDALSWKRNDEIHINLMHPGEYALSKPFVLKDADSYKMWYSFRANKDIQTYRIGFAHSADGVRWIRDDEKCGIDVSADGWDSDMICYPCILDYKGARYMIYNGNGYGKTGFGIAVFEN